MPTGIPGREPTVPYLHLFLGGIATLLLAMGLDYTILDTKDQVVGVITVIFGVLFLLISLMVEVFAFFGAAVQRLITVKLFLVSLLLAGVSVVALGYHPWVLFE